jgi:hypothetical protein
MPSKSKSNTAMLKANKEKNTKDINVKNVTQPASKFHLLQIYKSSAICFEQARPSYQLLERQLQ